MHALAHYLNKFSKLKVDRSKGSPAPHKPVLLLSIIHALRAGEITTNTVCITPELVARFKQNWNRLVANDAFRPNFALPFYHMKSEGFWHLRTLAGREILLTSSLSIRSFSHLRETIDYAFLNEDLFALLLNEDARSAIEHQLLLTYFPASHAVALPDSPGLYNAIEQQILHEPPALYRAEIASADEEEIFVRSGVFKKLIPRVYNNTCCISGMQIIAGDMQLIDACHIVPFSESHDDTVSNGISLCPNIHRAFDRYLVTIDDNYRVVVSPHFTERADSYSIRQFADRQILLPADERYHPSLENLAAHRRRFEGGNG